MLHERNASLDTKRERWNQRRSLSCKKAAVRDMEKGTSIATRVRCVCNPKKGFFGREHEPRTSNHDNPPPFTARNKKAIHLRASAKPVGSAVLFLHEVAPHNAGWEDHTRLDRKGFGRNCRETAPIRQPAKSEHLALKTSIG